MTEHRKKWIGCWGGLPCFKPQRGGKRVVPASRAPEGNGSATQLNGPTAVGLISQPTSVAPSLLAPPSSPASFTNSALPSTAQSPRCFVSLSANSPGDPSSTMFATGPYAHETQLVSPPVFSTFTTEPSTAPFTPPPELAHLTTPSSPDVPFAQFLSSSLGLRGAGKTAHGAINELQTTYPLSPGSPASTLMSPASRNSGNCLLSSFPEREFSSQWDASMPSHSTRHPMTGSGSLMPRDTNFFCPATFAQFYLDQPLSHSGGRLSISKDSDVHFSGGAAIQNWQNKNGGKQEAEEIEAYRASFGFSADEMITTSHYVEISDVMDDSFTIIPHPSDKSHNALIEPAEMEHKGNKICAFAIGSLDENSKALSSELGHFGDKAAFHEGAPMLSRCGGKIAYDCNHDRYQKPGDDSSNHKIGDDNDEDVFSNMGRSVAKRKYDLGLSYSDAEVEYRRGRSLREGRS